MTLAPTLLVSMPQLVDPNFSRAVVLLCKHSAKGAFGLVVNRPLVTSGRVVVNLGGTTPSGMHETISTDRELEMWIGGPVEPQRGFLLHSTDWGGPESIQVGDRWTLSATLEILRAIAEGRGPKRWLAALGYAGWGAGQLEEELCGNGWFATPGDASLLYDCDVNSRWAAAFKSAGIDPRLLAADYGTA